MVRFLRGHLSNTLVVNSYLILSMRFLGSATGFIFWAIASRALSEENVGLASSTIAASALLASLAQLGLGYGLVRFATHDSRIDALINSTCLLVGIVGTMLGIGFLLGIDWWSPVLAPVTTSTQAWASFVTLVMMTSMFQLLNWALLAKRRAVLALIHNTVQSVLNIIFFVVLALRLPTYLAAVNSYTVSTGISVGLALFWLLPLTDHRYRHALWPHGTRSHFASYSLSNFVTDQLQRAPNTLMTLVVVNVLGPAVGSYFFIVWSINTGLRALATSSSASLLMEGSQRPEMLTQYAIKTLRLAVTLAIGIGLGSILFSRIILMFYGPEYVERSSGLLVILSVSLVPSVILSTVISVLRINGRFWPLVIVTGSDLILGLMAVYLCMLEYGLNGIGMGWLGSRIAIIIVLGILWRWSSLLKPVATTSGPVASSPAEMSTP